MASKKVIPQDIIDEVAKIGNALQAIYAATNSNLRTLAKFAGMTPNSVKSVLDGHTANISSYALVAKALGTNLVDVIAAIKHPASVP